jgi:choline dehydrogenase-like flavoprotein
VAEDIADILIIGAGASSAAAAWSLSDTRMRIVCLEQGDWMNPADYPSNRREWQVLRNVAYSQSPNVRKRDTDYPINEDDSAVSVANFNGVGGGTVLYSGHFPRFKPSDFRTRSLDGVGDDWPVDYYDLEPYFAQNDRNMGVSGLAGDPAIPYHEPPLPHIPIGKMGNAVARGFNKLGWHWWPSDAAIISEDYEGRGKCLNLGPCNSGCAQGAKSSVDIAYWPLNQRLGVELRTRCRVREITVDDNDMATGAIYFDENGVEQFQAAHIVIMACNGVGTPRLLLNSTSKHFPDGLANRSGLVGKNLMFHPWGHVEGFLDGNLDGHLGPQGTSLLSQQFYETDPSRDFVRGYTLQVTRGQAPLSLALQGVARGDIPLGKGHHEAFRKYLGNSVLFNICCEDLPEEINTVTLDPELKDSSGIPAPKITYRLSENSQRMLAHGIRSATEALEAAGAFQVNSWGQNRHTGWHLMGTARMGKDPAKSVVNEWGRSHDVRNLFIIDGSIFVTAGAVNPTTTIQALALYIADNMKKNLANLFD